jgi:hypothetical protein
MLISLVDLSSAADLKPCTTSGEFDQGLQIDKAALESVSLLVSIAFPKFVKVGVAMEHELRKMDTSGDAAT